MVMVRKRIPILAFLVLGLPLTAAGYVFPARAAATHTEALNARLAADRARADALEKRLAADQARLEGIQIADLFGPSDEEKAAAAAAAQREDTQDSNISNLGRRADDIEESLRRLTGEIEVLEHRLDETDQRIDRMKKEFDYKLCALSAQQLGASASPGGANNIPCNESGPAATATPGPAANAAAPPENTENAAPGDTTRLAPPPGVLGTLPQNEANAPPPEPGAAAGQTASIDTHAQFNSAMQMLAKSQYDEARGAFRNFADAYPKDPLAPQALYWLGDVAYVQKDYPSAARAFAEELKKYPASSMAAESMLKLGQALIAMNQKQEGCTALRALASKYPSASKKVLNQAEAVRKAGGCRRR